MEFQRPEGMDLNLITNEHPEKVFREINKEILARDVFEEKGMDFYWVARKLKNLYENAWVGRVDKGGRVIQVEDQRLKLEILKTMLHVLGAFDQKGKASDKKSGLVDLIAS